MRSIEISTETFAAIWKVQEPGEASEDAILQRLLGLKPPNAAIAVTKGRDLGVQLGFVDPRYDVVIESGFKIYRIYKGQKFIAQAIQGSWYRADTGTGYPSLNELSASIGATKENAWANWYYEENGRRLPISNLRDKSKILRRSRRK